MMCVYSNSSHYTWTLYQIEACVYEHIAAGLTLRDTNSVGPGLGSNKQLHLFSKAVPVIRRHSQE